MRGEKHLMHSSSIHSTGSPPHARGKDSIYGMSAQDPGITPACAGKSHPYTQKSMVSWDHPRMRGEKTAQYQRMKAIGGSPPHARGKEACFVSLRT